MLNGQAGQRPDSIIYVIFVPRSLIGNGNPVFRNAGYPFGLPDPGIGSDPAGPWLSLL